MKKKKRPADGSNFKREKMYTWEEAYIWRRVYGGMVVTVRRRHHI